MISSLKVEFPQDHDKLKRIGHLVRVPDKISVGQDDDKLNRVGQLVRVPDKMSVGQDHDKLKKRIGHLVRALTRWELGETTTT